MINIKEKIKKLVWYDLVLKLKEILGYLNDKISNLSSRVSDLELNGGGGGSQNLDQVLTNGNTTERAIEIIKVYPPEGTEDGYTEQTLLEKDGITAKDIYTNEVYRAQLKHGYLNLRKLKDESGINEGDHFLNIQDNLIDFTDTFLTTESTLQQAKLTLDLKNYNEDSLGNTSATFRFPLVVDTEEKPFTVIATEGQITLQKIVDNDAYAEVDEGNSYIALLQGAANSKTVEIYLSSGGSDYSYIELSNSVLELQNTLGSNLAALQFNDGKNRLVQQGVSGLTALEFEEPIANIANGAVIKVPALPAGEYRLATEDSITLQKAVNNNNIIDDNSSIICGEGNITTNIYSEGVTLSNASITRDITLGTDVNLSKAYVVQYSDANGLDPDKGIILEFYKELEGINRFKFPEKPDGEYTLATEDILTLQGTLTNGTNASFDGGDNTADILTTLSGTRKRVTFVTSTVGFGTSQFSIHDQLAILSNNTGSNLGGSFSVANGLSKIQQDNGSVGTTVQFNTPTSASILNFPAPSVAGDYTLATLEDINKIKNEQGQIKVNYTGLSTVGFVAEVLKTLDINSATPTIVSSPTTTYPFSTPNNYSGFFDSSRGSSPIGRLIENPIQGQVHTWRFQISYNNKAVGSNGSLDLILANPVSGFQFVMPFTLPSGRTSGTLNNIAITIADEASIPAPNGYILQCRTSFSDANLTIDSISITRISQAKENQ